MDAEKLNHIAERLCSDSWSIYIGEPGNRDWMSIADAILTDGRAVAKAYLKLAKFKEYVHARLDAAGVPTDPDSPHKAEGCRIGGRLDYVLMHRSAGAVAAAVRVRMWKAGIALKDIYPGAKTRTDETDMLATDWRDLALDYLDLLPAEQPVKGDAANG